MLFVNDYFENTGIGNYAFCLHSELKKLNNYKMLFLKTEKKKPACKEKIQIIKSQIKFQSFNKPLNNLLVFPQKIPETDLIHLSNEFLGTLGVKNRPSIITCHNLVPLDFPNGYPKKLHNLLNKLIQDNAKCNCIITPSNFVKKKLKEYFGLEKNVKTIYHGVNRSIFKPLEKNTARKKLGLGKEQKILLNVGSEQPRKNIITCLRAFKEVLKEEKNCVLYRIGEQLDETKKQIKKMGIEKNVFYKTNVPNKEVALWYNACDALLFTSCYEGFGFPVLEAMACKTPVICSGIAPVREVSSNKCLEIKDAFDIESFKEKTLDVLFDEKGARKIGEREFKQSKNFNWKKCAEETKKEYLKFIDL